MSKNGEETWQENRNVGRVKIKRYSTENNVWQVLVSMICGLKATSMYDTKTINRILPMSLSSFILLRPVKIKPWNPSVAPCNSKWLEVSLKNRRTHHHSRFLVFGIRTSSKAFFSACPIHLGELPQKVTPAFQVTPCFIGQILHV